MVTKPGFTSIPRAASLAAKQLPRDSCAPAERQNLADLTQNDLRDEQLAENHERADQDRCCRPAELAAGPDRWNGESGRADEER
jgi:hypothetical protein